MSAAVGTFEWHLEQLGEHLCCRLVGDEQCGLWCGHGGEHVPYVPGEYLIVPPELKPLGWWRFRRVGGCPVCSGPVSPWPAAEAGAFHWVVDGQWLTRTGTLWRFDSCGCERFEAQR